MDAIHTSNTREQVLALLLDKTLDDSSLSEQEMITLLMAYSLATTEQLLELITNEKGE